MTCHNCQIRAHKHGKDRKGNSRFKCPECNKTFSEERQKPLDDMRLPLEKAGMALRLLVEGNSVRSVERLTGVHRDTILRLLVLAGDKCRRFMDEKIQKVDARHVQCDELWSYVGKKQKRVRHDDPVSFGDQYTFVALDAESKLVISYRVGKRTGKTAHRFLSDLAGRLADRCQITTDYFKPYVEQMENVFGADVDYGILVKIYGADVDAGRAHYLPARILGTTKLAMQGNPDEDLISTSHVERSNLTWRMTCRRFTRLTNAFSKKLANLRAAVALTVCWYNFCRIHSTLKCTPAMEAKVADRIWTLEEVLRSA